MAEEPTIGEVVRILAGLQRTIEQLSSKVLTVEVWKAERESMEYRIRENEKDIATLEAKTQADRDKRDQEKDTETSRANAQRREARFAIFTAVIAPILVGVVLAITLKG